MLDEQTTPNESFDSFLRFSGGAAPGGVMGRGRRLGIDMIELLLVIKV
jgi:hypothetical protein